MHPQLKITGDPIGLDSDQIDLLAEIIVQMMCQVRPTTHLDPQFLVKLTLKPGLWGFTELALSSGELPFLNHPMYGADTHRRHAGR
jgi:hypothetical protein